MIAPDPIPAPVPMDAATARAALLTIAAIHGGTVQRVVSNPPMMFCGYAVYAPYAQPETVVLSGFRDTPTWIWDTNGEHPDDRGLLRYARPSEMGRDVIPTGRIDRGLP